MIDYLSDNKVYKPAWISGMICFVLEVISLTSGIYLLVVTSHLKPSNTRIPCYTSL